MLLHTEFFNVYNPLKKSAMIMFYSIVYLSLFNRQTSEVKDPLRIRCLTLTDFGRAIDLKLLPPGTDFIGSCNTDAFECIEMKEKKPWKYQVSFIVITHKA